MTAARFCLAFVVAAALIVGIVGAFDVVVDPYLVFDQPRVDGFNAIKPVVSTRERLMKAYDAPRHDAATVVLGSSRSDIGLDPAHADWPMASRPVYNLSLAGAGAGTELLYLRHLIASRPAGVLRTVVLGLDFEYALASPEPVGPPRANRSVLIEMEQRLSVRADGSVNPERRLRVAKDVLQAAFSLDALADSMHTVMANHRTGTSDLDANGHVSEAEFRSAAAVDGFGLLFSQKNNQFVRDYGAEHQILRAAADGSLESLAAVDALAALASAHGIAVVVFVQPAHADRLELIDRLGYWDALEQWKSALTYLVAKSRHAGARIELWDFADYEAFSLEPVPTADDHRTTLEWFWEPAHYRTALGDRMIRRMLGADPDADGIGVRLAPENLASHLARVRTARDAYRRREPAATARLDGIICAVQSCAGPATAIR